MISTVRVASVLSLTLVLAACSSGESGNALVGSSNPSVPESSTLPTNPYVIPPEKEIDVDPFLARPCDLVSESMLTEHGYPVGGRPRLPGEDTTADVTGPYCGWSGQDDSRGLTVSVQSGNKQRGAGGLANLRRMYEEGRYAYWEDTTVVGYPAAYLDLADRRAEGGCGVAVGVANDMSFSVAIDAYAEQPNEACSVAAEFAADVIQNLHEGA